MYGKGATVKRCLNKMGSVVFLCDAAEVLMIGVFFFFNDTATTEIYTLSLHDALPICA